MTHLVASLPMYDWPELRNAHHNLWTGIQSELVEQGIGAPSELGDGVGLEFWRHPDLVLSQTCGLPYRRYLHTDVNLVATPDFSVEGCPPGYYCSVLVVRQDSPARQLSDTQSSRFAFNSTDSQSGYAAASTHCRNLGWWFASEIESGAHLNSANMVVNGEADIAALDAVSWRHMCTYNSMSDRLRVIARTEPTPGLPYICSRRFDPGLVRTAVLNAIAALSKTDANALGLRDFVDIPSKDYLAVE